MFCSLKYRLNIDAFRIGRRFCSKQTRWIFSLSRLIYCGRLVMRKSYLISCLSYFSSHLFSYLLLILFIFVSLILSLAYIFSLSIYNFYNL